MKSFGKTWMALAIGLSVLVPDLAFAAPPLTVPATGQSLVIHTGGVVCDLGGCRVYEHRRRRVYLDSPGYDDNDGPGFYREPPIYERPRYRRRIYVEPAPIYRDPPIYRPRPIYRDPPVYAAPVMSPEHVQWCLDRYRSYNPRTNRYMVRRNVFRACISPYS